MKLLKNGKDVSLDTPKVSELKKAINTWINGIKNHNFENLGDKIQISSVYYKPAYNVGLLTRFEKRILDFTQVPFTNQTIKEQTITLLSQVKRWNYKLTRADKDIYKTQIWNIPGSQKVITCPECSGKKKVTCPDCNHGKVVCYHCNGARKFTCTSCNGTGNHACNSCNGVGYTTTSRTKTRMKYTSYAEAREESYTEVTKHPCKNCGGKGSFPCTTCERTGFVACEVCNGKGKLTCKTCNGTAKITCPTCAGAGQVLKYIQLEHSFEDIDQKNCKPYDSLKDNFPKLSELSKKSSGFKLLEENKKSFPVDYLSDFPYISEKYNKLYNETAKIVQESNDSFIIDQQLLQVYEIPVYEISYSYKQKDYSLLVYSGDQHIYAPLSPLSEFSDSVLKKAKSTFKMGQLSKSLELLEQCISLNQENVSEEVFSLKEKAIKLIHRDYKVGSLLGLILSIGLFTSIINLFSNHIYFIIPRVTNFYHRITTLPKIVPWMLSGIFSILMIWFIARNSKYTIDKYGVGIKSKLFRISTSAINFLIYAISIGILLYLINSTGLLNPIALIFGYIYEKIVL